MARSNARSPIAGSRRGAILVSVLWILVFLGFLAVVLRLHMSAVVASVRVTEDKAAARIVAESGLARAVALVRAGPDAGVGPLADQIQDSVETATGTVSVILTNEAWRVDFNTAERPLIVGALRAAGATPDAADTLASRIVERRGKPAAPEIPGKAKDQPAPDPGQQTIGAEPIQMIAELALLPGMPESVAMEIGRYATVSSGLAAVRLEVQDERLLNAIPQLPAAVVAAILGYRAGRLSYEQLGEILQGVEFNTAAQALTWRARLQVDLPSGYGEAHEALVLVAPGDDAPYRILDWRRVTNEVE